VSVQAALRSCALWLALLVAPVARAHGGPPIIEAALAQDEAGPVVVELSEGFAVRTDDGSDVSWSFVCPALFGTDLPPPSASIAGEAWLAGATDLFRLGLSRGASAALRPDLAGPRVLALEDLDGQPLVLRLRVFDGPVDGSEVIRPEGEDVVIVYGTPVIWSALTVLPARGELPAQIWLARVEADGIELLAVSTDGQELDRQLALLPIEPLAVQLSIAGGHVFAHVTANGGYTLLHVATRGEPAFTAETVVTAALPVRGPALRGEEILLTRDAELLSWQPGGVEPSDSPLGAQTLTCLTPEHACTQRALYSADEVERAGSFEDAEMLLDLARLGPPQLAPNDAELKQQCDLQWMVFRADLVRTGIMTLGNPEPPSPDAGADQDASTDAAVMSAADASSAPQAADDGCSVQRARDARHGGAYIAIAALLVAVVLTRRRRNAA
jgi:hypothetical protein